MNDRNITNARFIQVYQPPQIDSHLTAKLYVDNATDKPCLNRNIQDSDYNFYNLTNINSITLNTQAVNDNQVITKTYVDQFHNDNERRRRDLGLSFYDESRDLLKNNQEKDLNDKKLTNVDSITVNRDPTSDNEVSNKKYIDDELDKNTILKFYQTLEYYLKVSNGIDTYNFTKNKKIQLTNTTLIKAPNNGRYLLQKYNIKCSDRNGKGKISILIKLTKTNSPTVDSGATDLAPIGDSFMFIETSSNNKGDNVFCSFEGTDNIQNYNITFYYNRFSAGGTKAMGRFRIQFLLGDNTWN